MTVTLSLIIPAYNEAERLPKHLREIQAYLDRTYGDRYEVIVVDDGSEDDLPAVLESASESWPQLRSIHLPQNQGKGAAVRAGMLAAAGDRLLFSDADGATPIGEERRLTAAMEQGADVAVGSRLLPAADIPRRRGLLRGLAGRLFAAVARRSLGLPVRDTQCGFKMFRREAARSLFEAAIEDRYLFDLEILALAVRQGLRIAEIPVEWNEVPGGRFRPLRELPRALGGLWRLRRRLRLG